ncbi:hypothetical protein [Xanthomonas arboricola]|uniref:Uncharacterized protein n=1 Tax=Xanthomonas arboricola TaxID=56448 RepID=A0AB73H2N1_9XANT|nr:hypothetical protein [Xanthomonas arboricola]MBB5672592.1 hypothetical protein [Xanthomonas arboricola]
MGLKRCGVVRFDSLDPHQGGWVSVDGEKARRINGVGALDNDTLWWSNLTFNAMFETQLHRTPYIKRTTYLTSWNPSGEIVGQDEICLAWGLLTRNFPEQLITEALSGIFSRTVRFAEQHYGLNIDREVPRYDNLADELRALLLPQKDKHLTPEVDAALSSAHQYYANCITSRFLEEDHVAVNFVAPAVPYAHEMLDLVVPAEQFDFLGSNQLPVPTRRLEWVLAQDRPVLASVRVSDVNPEYSSVIAYGNGARSGTNRRWATHPELLLLSKYARVEVDSVFLFGSYEKLAPSLQLPHFTKLQAMTPTAEIIASNHWISLARENPYNLEQVRSPQERALSPRAAWLNAMDRFMMYTYAIQLYRAGITVRRYGAGRVTAVVPKYNYRDTYEIASTIGLLAPPTISTDIRIQDGLQGYG